MKRPERRPTQKWPGAKATPAGLTIWAARLSRRSRNRKSGNSEDQALRAAVDLPTAVPDVFYLSSRLARFRRLNRRLDCRPTSSPQPRFPVAGDISTPGLTCQTTPHFVGKSRSSAFSQARKTLMASSLCSCVWEFSSWRITRSRLLMLRPLCSRTYLTASSRVSTLRRVSEAERCPAWARLARRAWDVLRSQLASSSLQ
jgi:hypothetical protein